MATVPTNLPDASFDNPRWAGVASFLYAMKSWGESNPVCHLSVNTRGMGGKIYSDTDMYHFRDGDSTNYITRISVHLRFPNEATFILDEENNELVAYLPKSDQLIKVDVWKEVAERFGMNLQDPVPPNFLSMLRVAFVETNANSRALTFAFKPEVLHLPEAVVSGDYTTFRIDTNGALQSIDQITGGERRVMDVKYISFDQATVAASAPQLPEGKPVVTGKPFDMALQEEIIAIRDLGTHLKT